MSAKILNGKDLAEKKLAELSLQIVKHKKAGLRMPGLAVILVGNDPASEIYVRKKNLACQRVGIHSQIIHLDTTISQLELLNLYHQQQQRLEYQQQELRKLESIYIKNLECVNILGKSGI